MTQLFNLPKSLSQVSLGVTLILFAGCAGPTNPWGHYGIRLPSEDQNTQIVVQSMDLADMESEGNPGRMIASIEDEVMVQYFPRRQNFHQTSEFSVSIKDTKKIPDNADIQLFYNGTNVTDSWLRNAKVSYHDEGRILKFAFHGLKLVAHRDHNITISYQRNKQSQPVAKKYLAPSCSLAALEPLGDLGPFRPQQHRYRHLIEGISAQEGVNPSLVAGLIAQESAFNPMAVSHAKAIGLTQVTQGASQHVLETYDEFPTYPQLHTYPVHLIKTMILSGEVNSKNEWRLNPRTSIRGGITYLKFVEDYWLSDHSHSIILKNYTEEEGILDDLILASYNSGPYRVKKALKKRGKDWLNSPHLNEAKKYVRKVKSYCYHFAANNNIRPRFDHE